MCTRNRHDKIAKAVRSVLAQDYESFDFTIVDQSTSDETERALDDFAGDHRLRYVHLDQAGLSHAYNVGIESTTGDILAFTDDDCIAAPDWLAHIVEAFAAESDGDLLYGQVVPYEATAYEIGGTPALAITSPQRLSRRDGFKVFGMGANFAARRRLFDDIGGFDEVLGGGGPLRSSQDFDLAYRTFKAGRVTLLRPEVTMRHDGHRNRDEWPSLLLAYGTGDGAFYTKHVRCRDPYALWLATRQFGGGIARWVVKKLLGRRPDNWNYFRGFLTGVRGSFRFGVDRAARMYRAAR